MASVRPWAQSEWRVARSAACTAATRPANSKGHGTRTVPAAGSARSRPDAMMGPMRPRVPFVSSVFFGVLLMADPAGAQTPDRRGDVSAQLAGRSLDRAGGEGGGF